MDATLMNPSFMLLSLFLLAKFHQLFHGIVICFVAELAFYLDGFALCNNIFHIFLTKTAKTSLHTLCGTVTMKTCLNGI